MPWLGDDFGMKDPQALPGLSLVQWMNMQQNPSLANSIQPNYMHSLSGSVLQSLAGADLSRQLGMPGVQVPQQNNLQFNGQRQPQPSQHLDQLQKLPATSLNPLASIIQPQQQLTDITQQQQRQALMNQTLPTSQVQAQLLQGQNLVQSQNVLQQPQGGSNPQLQRNLSQNMQSSQCQQQQPIMSPNQQQNLMTSQSSDPISQQLNMSENQIQLQFLQKLHQQQQSLLAQQSGLQQQPSQLGQIHDQQKQLLDVTQSFSRSMTSSQMLDVSQTTSTSMPQSHILPQQMTRTSSQNNLRFSQPPQQAKQQQAGVLPELHGHVGHPLTPTNQLSAAGSSLLTGVAGGGQSAITDEIPSCSTSPSTNNCSNVVQPIMNGRTHRNTPMGDEITQPSATLISSSGFEAMSGSSNLVKELPPKTEVKPSLNVSKSQNQGFFAQHPYLNASGAQMDYLDSSSSATSVCLSQNDVQLQHNTNQMSFNSQPVLFRDTSQEEVHADPRTNVSFGSNIDSQLGMPMMPDSVITKGLMGSTKDFSNSLASGGGMLSAYENPKESQPELSTSMVSQSFGVPDMAFNSIDSAMNDNGFMNRNAWAPPPQLPRMRTYTKVSNGI